MNQRYLRNITLLLLVWLASQQAFALVLHGVEHSPDGCHEQVAVTSADCFSDQSTGGHGSHQPLLSSQKAVCDHCAAFCQPVIITSFSISSAFEGQPVPMAEPVLSTLVSAISVPYRPPILI